MGAKKKAAVVDKSPQANGQLISRKEDVVAMEVDVRTNGTATPTSSKKKKSQQVSLGERRKQIENQQSGKVIETMDSLNATAKILTRPTSSGDSLVVLLTQGLMAHDNEKLDAVLSNADINVIQATLAEMQVTHIVPLLRAIETRLRNRKVLDIRPWLRWTQCILTMHMSYLSSLRSLETDVGGLLEWMRSRSSNASRLLALHGKMSVLVEHIEKRSNKHMEPLPQPLVVFNTDSVDTSDEEDDSAGDDDHEGASSNDEWWDDGELLKDDAAFDDDDEDEDDDDDDDETPSRKRHAAIGGGESGDASDDDEEDMEGGDASGSDESMEED